MKRVGKKAMLEALEKSLGVIQTACKKVGIHRTTHHRWLKKDPKYEAAVKEIDGIAHDYVISQLFKKISEGDMQGIKAWLSYQGHRHGWVEKKELKVEGKMNQVLTADDFRIAFENSKDKKS